MQLTNYKHLIYNQKKLFNRIDDTKTKSFVIQLLLFSLILFVIWIARTLLVVKSSVISTDKYLYTYLFQSINPAVIMTFLAVLIITTIVSWGVILVVCLVAKFISLIFRQSIPFNKLFKISVISFIPILLGQLIYLLLTLFSLNNYQVYITNLSYAHSIILFLIGIGSFIANKKMFKMVLVLSSIVLILLAIFASYKLQNKSETGITDPRIFSAKIGNEEVFNGADVSKICSSLDCSGVNIDSCFKQENQWACSFSFRAELNDNAAKKIQNSVQKLGDVEKDGFSYLSEPILFLLENNTLDTVWIESGLRNSDLKQVSITGFGKGATRQDAILKAINQMVDLQRLLKK